jgi:hypothetical protein
MESRSERQLVPKYVSPPVHIESYSAYNKEAWAWRIAWHTSSKMFLILQLYPTNMIGND